MNERLGKMRELGQAPWVDELSRDDTRNGGLQAMIDDGIVGVTSNPAIFQKAIANSDLYDDQLRELASDTDDPKEMFWGIAGTDIQEACDVLAPVYEGSGGVDGYVSLEVQPDIAYDTQATIDEAEKLHGMVDRPNLFIKIPATLPGLVAIEEMISRGKSINVTLIFSLERYREVARAYIRGIQRLVENGGDPSGVRSVASFFVSRIDAEADDRLEKLGRDDLKGKLAIANAKLAYRVYGQVFSGSRWRSLEEQGATRQRLLWASTSTKNPDYPDTVYVDNLVGPETVNTMPKKTIEAVMDHGEIQPVLTESLEDAVRLLDDLREAGLDYEEVTDILEMEGIQKFADPFNEMLDEIKNKGRQLVS
ncbi:MAG: Transaldolase [uncultured Rubrobacteraceae bacterium]|uniref:Transaldolase n=1 Tax=uncultured Rubrobacteraceae bacterium TaxID=349277 RepID=A0A6J4TLD6_9ACTN|nr:MAG: Transaldolase [uncultured Rubrobacteraceae bacterium]